MKDKGANILPAYSDTGVKVICKTIRVAECSTNLIFAAEFFQSASLYNCMSVWPIYFNAEKHYGSVTGKMEPTKMEGGSHQFQSEKRLTENLGAAIIIIIITVRVPGERY